MKGYGYMDVKEFTVGIMKFSVNMEHPSGMVIKANGGYQFLYLFN